MKLRQARKLACLGATRGSTDARMRRRLDRDRALAERRLRHTAHVPVRHLPVPADLTEETFRWACELLAEAPRMLLAGNDAYRFLIRASSSGALYVPSSVTFHLEPRFPPEAWAVYGKRRAVYTEAS